MSNNAVTNVGYVSGSMHYPFIFDQKDKFDRFSMVLTLEGDQLKAAKQLGLKVLQNDEKFNGLPYITLKSSFAPKLFNADKSEYSGPTRLQNGSQAVVKVTQRPYNNKFGTGVTTYMSAIMITDPIEYVPASEGGGGFDAPVTAMLSQAKKGQSATTKAPAKNNNIGF
jgi:hypothetical protein